MTAALEMRGVTPSQKLLLIAMANYANEDGQCWPSQARLARDTCLSDRTIRTVLADLKKAGLIEVERRLRPDGSATTSIVTLVGLRRPVVTTTPPEMISTPPGNDFPTPQEATSYLTTFEPPLEPLREPTTINASDWRRMITEAREAAGDAADLTRPAMLHAADLKALVAPISGEPCTWDEVLTAIEMTAMRQRQRGKLIESWKWVQGDAIALRDKRLNAINPEVGTVVPIRATGPPGNGIIDQIAATNAEARRIALEG